MLSLNMQKTKSTKFRRWDDTGCQNDHVMRIISDLVRATARPVLGKDDIDCNLPKGEDRYTDLDRVYERLKDPVDERNTNDTEDLLTDELDTDGLNCLEMTLTFYTYLNQLRDDELYAVGYSREGTVDGISSVCAGYGISGFKHFINITMI